VTQFTGAVVVCCRDNARFTAFWESVYGLRLPPGLMWNQPGGVSLIRSANPSIAAARNQAVLLAKQQGCQWLLWLDDDQLCMPNTLLKFLEHPESIVIGLTLFRRTVEGSDRFFPIWSQQFGAGAGWNVVTTVPPVASNGLVPLVSGTMGGVLTRMDVFETLPGPWFTTGQEGPVDEVWEDIAFYQAAKRAGIDVWGDPNIRFGHMATFAVWPQFHDGQWATVFARDYEPIMAVNWTDQPLPASVPAPRVSVTAGPQMVEV